MNVKFKSPYFKKKSYISEPINNISIDLYDIKIHNIMNLSNKTNALKLKLYINPDNKTFFNDIDKCSLDTVLKYNKKWFSNDLTDEELKNIFYNSVCEQTNILESIVSNNTKIYYNDKNLDINNEIFDIFKNSDKYIFNFKIKLLGLFIFKDKIVNKWLINEIKITNYKDDDDIEINNLDITKEWENTLNDTINSLDEYLIIYKNKIDKINSFKIINTELINEIKNMDISDKNWNNKIFILKNNIKNILSINDNR